MIRFLVLLSFIFLLIFSWPLIENKLENTDYQQSLNQIKSEIEAIKDNPEVLAAITNFYQDIQQLMKGIDVRIEDLPLAQQESEPKNNEKLQLKTPTEQIFSIHNIELGDTKEDIENNFGIANRTSLNEYGTNWYTYHDNYQNFFMVMYDENNIAAGLYTNQDVLASSNEIKLGSSKENVRTKLGEPITKIQKGLVIYQLQENSDYDMFLLDNTYTTIFYDKHEDNTVTAIQLISQDIENKRAEFYTKASPALKEGFEYQLFDLTNASRVNHALPILSWDSHVRETARDHSTDMAVNQFFDHTNLEGQSPFDRMEEDQVIFNLAGENLATGQVSSIFAHEGLMNSLGHRENILRKGYEFLGVGVAFNQKSQPYYTENFFAN
jgi:uncharacterized protein YkwD